MLTRTARLIMLPFAMAATAPALLAQNTAACRPTVSGDVRLHTLTSRIFGNTRTLRVLVPPGYDAPENAAVKYPVLYLLDGQNLFDACLSEISRTEWGVDETVYRLIREKKIPPLIVLIFSITAASSASSRTRAAESYPPTVTPFTTSWRRR